MMNTYPFSMHRGVLLLCMILMTAGCSERLTGNAFKADGGCKVKQYNVEWAAKNIDHISWDGPCINREANGYGKLTVTLLDKQQETYVGSMRDGKFDTTQQRAEEKSEYATGNKRLSGEFRAGRFLSGQIYVNDKLDFDGILYQPSRRYASGKSYFPDGSYIDGSFYDKEGNVSTNGTGVYQGIVYTEKSEPVAWIYQERVFQSKEQWTKEITSQKDQLEAKTKREADIKTGVSKMLAQFEQLVQRQADTPADQHMQALQRRDAAQAKFALLEKLVWQCHSAGCDAEAYLRSSREAASKQLAASKELVAKLPPLEKPPAPAVPSKTADTKVVDATPADGKVVDTTTEVDAKAAVVKEPVKVKPLTLAKLQASEEYTKGLQELRLLLKLK